MKLILTESQYKLIESIVNEENYGALIKRVDVGDKIQIVDAKNNKLSFNVVVNDSGQLYLKSIDNNIFKNDYFFISFSDLQNNNLTFRRVNIPENLRNDKDVVKVLNMILKTTPVREWKKSTFKNINKMFVSGVEVDIEQKDPDEEKFKNYKKVSNVDDFLSELNSLKDGSSYNFKLSNGGEIIFKVIDNKNNKILLELVDTSGPIGSVKGKLSKYDLLLNVNSSNVEQYVSSDSDEDVDTIYNIKLDRLDGGKKIDSVRIIRINDIELYSKDSDNKDDDKSDEKEKELTLDDVDDMNDDELVDFIQNSPEFVSAFLRKPTFMDAVLGRSPGGLLAARKILSSVADYRDKLDSNIYQLFTNNKEYIIKITNKNVEVGDIVINRDENIFVKCKKTSNSILLLPNTDYKDKTLPKGVKIVVNNKIDDNKYNNLFDTSVLYSDETIKNIKILIKSRY
jgi:hypothetical protein